jgi:hypothetical protein
MQCWEEFERRTTEGSAIILTFSIFRSGNSHGKCGSTAMAFFMGPPTLPNSNILDKLLLVEVNAELEQGPDTLFVEYLTGGVVPRKPRLGAKAEGIYIYTYRIL